MSGDGPSGHARNARRLGANCKIAVQRTASSFLGLPRNASGVHNTDCALMRVELMKTELSDRRLLACFEKSCEVRIL